jgi:uncharacterized protein YegL
LETKKDKTMISKFSIESNVKTTSKSTELVMLIDRSGSMGWGRGTQESFEKGVNTFLSGQKEGEGHVRLTIITFDNNLSVEYHGDLMDYGNFRLHPRGGTALNDALGFTIDAVGELLAKTPENERAGLVTFVTTTDGGENGSRTFNTRQIEEKIAHQTSKYGWNFIYIGADYDANSEAGYASNANMTANFSKDNSEAFYGNTSRKLRSARSSLVAGASSAAVTDCLMYTAEEQTENA